MSKQVVQSNCFFASISAIIQSLLWMTFHLTCILIHADIITYDENAGNDLLFAFYRVFLDPEQLPMLGFYTHAYNYYVISYLYLIGTFIWFVVSCYLFWLTVRSKFKYMHGTLITWSVVTGLLLLFDLVFLGFLCFDYSFFHEVMKEINTNIFYNTSYVLQMLITTRLGLLWVLNATFVVILACAAMKKSYEIEDTYDDWPGIFNSTSKKVEAYNQARPEISSPQPLRPRKTFYDNDAFRYDDDIDTLSRNSDNLYADVSNRLGSRRKSPTLTSSIPIPPPMTPNLLYRPNSPVYSHIHKRRNQNPSSVSDDSSRYNNPLSNRHFSYN